MTCAGDNTVAALLAGALDGTAARELERHLDTCHACRQFVANLGRGLSALATHDGLPRVGERVGRYTIRRVIGVGGMGVVYEAIDATLDRRVALKLVRPDVACNSRVLLGEARALARLSHRNIVAIHDVGTSHGQVYLCMEYVAGTTLREWLAEPRTRRELLAVFDAAGRGLAYVHREGLVHLDFKPDNVLVDRAGRVVVTDFGVAALVDHARGHAVGTPAYMAPEQRRGGRTDARADQYAFCVALARAFAGDDGAAAVRMPLWVRDVIERGTRERPDERFATIDDLLAALARGAGRVRRRAGALLAVAAAALVAIVVARGPRTVTTVVDRPVIERVPMLVDDERAAPDEAQTPAEVAIAAAVAIARADTERSRAARMLALASSLDRRVPERALVFAGTSIASPRRSASLAARSAARSTDRDRDEASACDDGGELACATEPPWCPPGTTLALQAGCCTCADEHTCAALGAPHACDDGSPLRCPRAPPTCSGRLIASVRGGCWECADPFACTARSYALPVPLPLGNPTGNPSGNGSGVGSGGGSGGGGGWGSGSGLGSGSDNGTARCGNGFCEIGEDHASCPGDCCEMTGSGACVAVCGNGFCEAGEDHASCAADCCVVGANGSCVP